MIRLSSVPFILTASALATAGLACQTVTRAANPAEQPVADSLFFDDFSDTRSGWDREQYDGGSTDYLDGQYQILVTASEADYWANPGLDFADVRVETLATKADGPDDNDFGLICRYQDVGNFYYFVISSDGHAGILKVNDRETTALGTGKLEPSNAIRQGSATNLLAAECVGSRLRLYVNNELVAEVVDTDFASGDVGLIAGTFESPGADIRFDDFRVIGR
jgi:hypothetical protein